LLTCPKCKAVLNARDRFCPKCGADIAVPLPPAPGAVLPNAPRQVDAGLPNAQRQVDAGLPNAQRQVDAVGANRTGAARASVLAGGRKYAGLTRAAEMMIRTAGIVRLTFQLVAILAGFTVVLWLKETPAICVLAGLTVGMAVALGGWVVYLAQTVVGELMYVVMDVEESLGRQERTVPAKEKSA
jgi:hypothetical protein